MALECLTSVLPLREEKQTHILRREHHSEEVNQQRERETKCGVYTMEHCPPTKTEVTSLAKKHTQLEMITAS